MSNLELITTYYRYQQWANRHLLDAAALPPFELLTTPVLTGFDPVRSALVHTMWAQMLWLHRFQGLPRVPEIKPEDFADLASLRQRWDEIDAETDAFLDILTEEQLNSGDPPLWRIMLHQANHQTYHRGEIAAVLTHLGASPGELDLNRMFDGRR